MLGGGTRDVNERVAGDNRRRVAAKKAKRRKDFGEGRPASFLRVLADYPCEPCTETRAPQGKALLMRVRFAVAQLSQAIVRGLHGFVLLLD